MPLYDFECPHKHRFERQCLIADMRTPVPCEGTVNQLVDDSVVGGLEDKDLLPEGHEWVDAELVDASGLPTVTDAKEKILVKKVPCILTAILVMGPHNNPGGALNHNTAANRDAAREGRYDPQNPSRKTMTKGRVWRK